METKPFNIPKQLVVDAYKHVKASAGSAGVDRQSLGDFEKNLKSNLYKIWNRLSSGTYFPPPVMAVSIPKKSGGTRILGVPTVSDRIAQMVVKIVFEPMVEPYFLPDSYGYRPSRSALDAIKVTRERCWRYSWLLEFDIKGLFDNISHSLLMRAVRKHTDCKWVILYITRWLEAPMQLADESLVTRSRGTPQGGVISPVLSNLFLHYVFDKWMQHHTEGVEWCRYADDGVVHCKTEKQAQWLLHRLTTRFAECGLELHPDKTQIVYCKDGKRKANYPNTSFDFLGFTFRARRCQNSKDNSLFVSFTPAVSNASLKEMRDKTRSYKWHRRTEFSLSEIARTFNPVLSGWLNYYGKFGASYLMPMIRHFNRILVKWAMRKFKRFYHRKKKTVAFFRRVAKDQPDLFVHWRIGMVGVFV